MVADADSGFLSNRHARALTNDPQPGGGSDPPRPPLEGGGYGYITHISLSLLPPSPLHSEKFGIDLLRFQTNQTFAHAITPTSHKT